MKYRKIDSKLFELVSTLKVDEKLECIIKSNSFHQTKKLLKSLKIDIANEYLFINAMRIFATKKEILTLSKTSSVEYIFSVSSACTMMNVSKKVLDIEDLPLSGKGVNIAFIDTGITKHFDFIIGKNRLIKFVDFINGETLPYDDNGHGTFVAGVCAGNGAMSGGKFSGIAPQSNIISLKALNGSGEASADKILDAMEWVYDNAKKFDIKVVCMSFGSEPLGYNDPIMSGAEALWNKGVTVVAAAGNSGPEFQTIKSPGVSNKIITVGGFDDNRLSDDSFNRDFFEIAKFSSRGPAFERFKPDLVAPSVDIISTAAKHNYATLSGTSVATPMIAGLCALLLERDNSLSPDKIKALLLGCAQPITLNFNLEGRGYPLIKKLF